MNERKSSMKQFTIECPNTIFQLYVYDQTEVSKVFLFLRNIRSVEKLGLTDIYNWCNRQGIEYKTQFNYRKDFSVWENIQSYLQYFKWKRMYQVQYGAA